jgi:hypothetical protein
MPDAEDLLKQILQEVQGSTGGGKLSSRRIDSTVLPGSLEKGHFVLVFFSVLGLTLLSMGANIYLVVTVTNSSADVGRLVETLSTTWKMGFGAIVGLFGSRALK